MSKQGVNKRVHVVNAIRPTRTGAGVVSHSAIRLHGYLMEDGEGVTFHSSLQTQIYAILCWVNYVEMLPSFYNLMYPAFFKTD